MEGRGEGESRVRCFVVGCLGGGGGGCKESVAGVGVDSVDKEHRGVRVDTIRRRGACRTDNMLHTLQGRRFGMGMPSRPTGYGPIRIRELPISHVLDYTTHTGRRENGKPARMHVCLIYCIDLDGRQSSSTVVFPLHIQGSAPSIHLRACSAPHPQAKAQS